MTRTPPDPPFSGWRSRLRLGRAEGGIAAISSSAAAGHAVTLLATPLLSRIYSPEAFGTFASLMAIVAIASTGGSLRLESAVPIATPSDARNMVKSSAWSSLFAGVACAVILSVAGHDSVARSPRAGFLLVVYLVWVTAMYAVLTSHSLRSHEYSAVARRNLLQATGTAGGQLLVSRWLQSAIGLTSGLALGRSLGVASLVRESQLLKEDGGEAAPSQRDTLTRYWRFPVAFMPAALLNVLGSQLPILLVTAKYGTESSGNLAQAITFGAVPAALLGGAVASVVMAEMAARVRAGELDQRRRYLRISKGLAPLGLGWFLFLVLGAPSLLPLVLGPQWRSSGEFAAALAIGAGLGLVVSPLTVVLFLYERSILNLGLDILRVVLVLAVGVAAWRLGYGPVEAVFVMSAAMGVVYLTTWLVGLRVVSRLEDSGVTDATLGQAE